MTEFAELLERYSQIALNQEAIIAGQFDFMGGSIDDGYNAEGGTTGARGYYPLTDADGNTVLFPCWQRFQVLALGGGDPEVLETILGTQVGIATAQAAVATAAAATVATKVAEAAGYAETAEAAVGLIGTAVADSQAAAGVATTKAGEASGHAADGLAYRNTAQAAATTATAQAGIATTKAGEAGDHAAATLADRQTAVTAAATSTTQAGIATTKAGEASGHAADALADREAAEAAAGTIIGAVDAATEQAGIATTQAGISTTKAVEASGHAADAHADRLAGETAAETSTTQAGIATTKAGEASTDAADALSHKNDAETAAASILGAVDDATAQAGIATTQAGLAGDHSAAAEGFRDQSEAFKNAAEVAAAEAEALAGGNAPSASILLNARNIAMSGDVAWSVSFNGGTNVTAVGTLTTVNANVGTFGSAAAVPILTLDAKGRVTEASTAALGTAATKNTGTASGDVPLLGAGGGLTIAGAVAATNFSGSSSGTNTGDQTTISGNAGSATILESARSIAMTGDVAWSVSFNGSGNVTAGGTLATVNGNVGSYGSASAVPIITVNAKGLVTAVATAALGTAAALDKATFAQIRAGTADKLLAMAELATAADWFALTDASTIAIDGANFLGLAHVTIAASRTLGVPTNMKPGGFLLAVTNTGSFTLSFASGYKADGGLSTVPALPTGATTTLYHVQPMPDGSPRIAQIGKDVKA